MAGRGFRTQAPREGTVIIAALLWVIGLLDLVLPNVNLDNNFGPWALVLAGALLLLGALVDQI